MLFLAGLSLWLVLLWNHHITGISTVPIHLKNLPEMKRRIMIAMATMAFLLLNTTKGAAQGMSVNTTGSRPDTSAILDVSATTKGMLMPRMTIAQRNAIVLPATGLLVFQTDGTAGYYYNAGTSASPIWTGISSSGLAPGTSTGQMMYWSGSAWLNLGIGSNGQVLTVNSGVPIWAATSTYIATTPVLSTNLLTNIGSTGVTCGGNISSSGGAAVTARGACWSTSPNPTEALSTKTSDGTGTGAFTSTVTGLTNWTMYYLRAYATNSVGTAYGAETTFIAAAQPTLTASSITAITTTTATANCIVNTDGGVPVTVRGVCWSPASGPTTALITKTTDGTGIGSFTSSITGLAMGSTYYVRAYATNSSGTAYSNELSFITSSPPILTTTSISSISSSGASSGGNISSDGGLTVSARGVCWSTATGPTTALSTKTTDGTGTGSYSSSITGLTSGTVYYVRAYATNAAGTTYGTENSFTSYRNIGDSYLGGTVGYIFVSGDPGYDATTQHGFVFSMSGRTNAIWGCYGTYQGISATGLLSGQSNSGYIAAFCGSSTAAYYALNYSIGGYSGWWLPSRDEMLNIANSGLISGGLYWTSSEYDAGNAVGVNPNTGFGTQTVQNLHKMGGYYVLPIRNF